MTRDLMTKKYPKTDNVSGLVGERVDVHWHLRKECYSVRHAGIVRAYVPQCAIRDAEFRVGPKGHARAVREGVRNVHARVYGTILGDTAAEEASEACVRAVRYNPFETEGKFVYVDTGAPVERAPLAVFADGVVWVPDAR